MKQILSRNLMSFNAQDDIKIPTRFKAFGCFVFVFWFSFWVTICFVAWHFIAKYW